MDRQIVYPGQILPETTLLQMAKDAMSGNSKLAAAMLGTSTIANGFAVTPTGPASLQVVVAPGEIYAMANIDSLAFSTLPADTTHSILKQGILLDGVTLSCPAPTTTGQSINYLVQATYQDQDSTPVLLPYYNSANPALPFSGMGNNGLTQNTARKGVAIVQVKAGASAASGSQVTPAPDSGYVGLYVVTVAFGQTVINSGNISQYAGAPLLPSGIIQSIQSGNTTFALDVGTVNACAATFSPAVTVSDSLVLRFKAANTNTGATTFSPNGITAAPIVGGNHAALQGGEIIANGDVWVQWNSSIGGGSWVLVESSGGGFQVAPATKTLHAVSAGQIQGQGLVAFTAAGTSPAFTLAPVPALSGYAANQRFQVTFNAAGGATPTINVSGLGAKNIKQYNSTGGKIAAAISAGQTSDIFYDGTDFVLLDQLPNSTGVTAAQFDNSLNLATTAFVQGVGLQFSGITGISANTTFTAAIAGGLVYSTNATPLNATLPLASAVPAKTTITFWNFGAGSLNLICSGSDGMYTNQIVTTYQLVMGTSVTLVSNGNSAWLVIGLQNATGVTGGFKNLAGSATGLSAVVTYTADELMVSNPAGFYQTLKAVSVTPSFTISGAGGLDVGAANSQTASTWYSVWVIWNGGTPSGLLSLSATAPTMPSGYTHKARVGWVRTDGTASKNPLRFFQVGRTVQYSVATSGNTLNAPVMVSGASGNVTTPLYTAVPVAAFVPPTAVKIKFSIRGTENGMVFLCAPNGNYGTNQVETSPPAFMGLPAGQGGVIVYPFEFVLEESNIYYASNAANSRLRCMGWEDNF
ncbi:hypothetical protein [Pseudomonas sp. OVF7]|uniref:hypothetical protein n=1 Tax=unclassified Pseudomonas TaxID=196821 RepID=UPI00272A448C|nr:hypothetical protein [Pseudomonas sp. OVF7]WLD64696.1 hypothetical protein QU606_20310 [Pseudomonas sp. OVF7]